MLLGLPSKLDAKLDEYLVLFLGDPISWPVPNRAKSLLFFRGTLDDAGKALRDYAVVDHGCKLGEHVVQLFMQRNGGPESLCIEKESSAAPCEPNAFSDGSVVSPFSQCPWAPLEFGFLDMMHIVSWPTNSSSQSSSTGPRPC